MSASAPVPFVPAFTFTSDERAYQDRRLRSVISSAWEKEEGIAFWRNTPEIKCVHRQWARSYRVPGTEAWSRYREMVLAMAWSAADYFVPVDFWPDAPPRTFLDQSQRVIFEVILNTQREVAGVFSPDRLRSNKHYYLLLAHLIWCPAPITEGNVADIIAPYPWPFVIRHDEMNIPRMEPQEDLGPDMEVTAMRVHRDLQRDARQAARTYDVSRAEVERRERVKQARLDAGRVANILYKEYERQGKDNIIARIMKHDDFKKMCRRPGAEINITRRNVQLLRKEYLEAIEGYSPKRGRPTKKDGKAPKPG